MNLSAIFPVATSWLSVRLFDELPSMNHAARPMRTTIVFFITALLLLTSARAQTVTNRPLALDECIRLGGSVTGEHGIGVEKLDFMSILFTQPDLDFMTRLRSAFNPKNNCSPFKMLPTAGGCAEQPSFFSSTKPGRRAAV